MRRIIVIDGASSKAFAPNHVTEFRHKERDVTNDLKPTEADIAAAREYAAGKEEITPMFTIRDYLAGRMDGIAAERERAAKHVAGYCSGDLDMGEIADEIRRGPQS